MFCKNCGTEIVENTKFCTGCGKIIVEKQSVPQENPTAAEEIEETVVETPVPEEETVIETPVFDETANPLGDALVVEETQEQAVEAPAETFAQQPSEPVQKPKEYSFLKKVKLFFKNLFSVLCCICIFAVSVSLLSVLSFRLSLAPTRISYILDNLDIAEMVEDEEIQDSLLVSLDGEKAVEIYENSTIKKFVETKMNEYADYILHDADSAKIKAEDLVDLVKENEEIIEKVSGEAIYGFDYDRIEKFGEELENNEIIDTVVSKVKLCASILSVIALFVLAALLCVLLWYIRKSYDSLIWTGSALSISSLLFAIAVLALKFILPTALAAEGTLLATICKVYLVTLLPPVLICSGCMFAIGAVLIISYIVARTVKKARA